jgi:hypothetical protein
MPRVPASLRALLAHVIDYAGLYPPAALPLEIVLERYRGFRASPENWMLNRLVLPMASLAEAAIDPGWPVTLLIEEAVGDLPSQVETLETRRADFRGSRPTYYELPLSEIPCGFAKVRAGGLTPESIPTPETLAAFLADAAARRLAFKATAGLHHPLRSTRALTYAIESPRAAMHGFLNVFVAAAFAWQGIERAVVVDLLQESDIASLRFDDDGFEWRGRRLSTPQVAAARRDFAHSFGSCSFEEPVSELREAGLLR